LTDVKIIADLVAALKVPMNIVGKPWGPNVSQLEKLGVARVSTASGPSLVAMSLTRHIADELRAKGEFELFETLITRPEAQKLFAPRPS
jgi:2-methylisocitrate lyase-like PEP mutase family enzyme